MDSPTTLQKARFPAGFLILCLGRLYPARVSQASRNASRPNARPRLIGRSGAPLRQRHRVRWRQARIAPSVATLEPRVGYGWTANLRQSRRGRLLADFSGYDGPNTVQLRWRRPALLVLRKIVGDFVPRCLIRNKSVGRRSYLWIFVKRGKRNADVVFLLLRVER